MRRQRQRELRALALRLREQVGHCCPGSGQCSRCVPRRCQCATHHAGQGVQRQEAQEAQAQEEGSGHHHPHCVEQEGRREGIDPGFRREDTGGAAQEPPTRPAQQQPAPLRPRCTLFQPLHAAPAPTQRVCCCWLVQLLRGAGVKADSDTTNELTPGQKMRHWCVWARAAPACALSLPSCLHASPMSSPWPCSALLCAARLPGVQGGEGGDGEGGAGIQGGGCRHRGGGALHHARCAARLPAALRLHVCIPARSAAACTPPGTPCPALAGCV